MNITYIIASNYTHTFYMLLVFVRTAIIFVTLLFLMRLMGKSQIGEMQPFEFVITLLIAELACIPMADSSIPLLYGIVSVVCIFILHQVVNLINLKSQTAKAIICGKPSLVITKDGVDEHALKKNNLNIDDLVESMRGAGYFSLDDVYYGLYEANGSFSALEKENKSNSLAYTIISHGNVNTQNLKRCSLTHKKVLKFVAQQNTKLNNVLVLTVDGNGRCYFQERNQPYKILEFKGEKSW